MPQPSTTPYRQREDNFWLFDVEIQRSDAQSSAEIIDTLNLNILFPEFYAIREFFLEEGRNPTIPELRLFSLLMRIPRRVGYVNVKPVVKKRKVKLGSAAFNEPGSMVFDIAPWPLNTPSGTGALLDQALLEMKLSSAIERCPAAGYMKADICSDFEEKEFFPSTTPEDEFCPVPPQDSTSPETTKLFHPPYPRQLSPAPVNLLTHIFSITDRNGPVAYPVLFKVSPSRKNPQTTSPPTPFHLLPLLRGIVSRTINPEEAVLPEIYMIGMETIPKISEKTIEMLLPWATIPREDLRKWMTAEKKKAYLLEDLIKAAVQYPYEKLFSSRWFAESVSAAYIGQGGLVFALLRLLSALDFNYGVEFDAQTLSIVSPVFVDDYIFSDSPGRFLVLLNEKAASMASEFAVKNGLEFRKVGRLIPEQRTIIHYAGRKIINIKNEKLFGFVGSELNKEAEYLEKTTSEEKALIEKPEPLITVGSDNITSLDTHSGETSSTSAAEAGISLGFEDIYSIILQMLERPEFLQYFTGSGIVLSGNTNEFSSSKQSEALAEKKPVYVFSLSSMPLTKEGWNKELEFARFCASAQLAARGAALSDFYTEIIVPKAQKKEEGWIFHLLDDISKTASLSGRCGISFAERGGSPVAVVAGQGKVELNKGYRRAVFQKENSELYLVGDVAQSFFDTLVSRLLSAYFPPRNYDVKNMQRTIDFIREAELLSCMPVMHGGLALTLIAMTNGTRGAVMDLGGAYRQYLSGFHVPVEYDSIKKLNVSLTDKDEEDEENKENKEDRGDKENNKKDIETDKKTTAGEEKDKVSVKTSESGKIRLDATSEDKTRALPLSEADFTTSLLFAETPATFLAEVDKDSAEAFVQSAAARKIPVLRVGRVSGEVILILGREQVLFKLEPVHVSQKIKALSHLTDETLVSKVRYGDVLSLQSI